MATFAYTAMDAKGKDAKGTVEAPNQQAAIAQIREKGLFPTQVIEAAPASRGGAAAKGGKGMKKELRMPTFGRVKPKQLMIMTRQLATLIDAGLPLLRGLQVIARQEKNLTLKKALLDMAEAIQSGSTLAEAMAHHPKIFNRLYINMVKAGEIGGVLDVVLNRLAEYMEKAQKIKNKVKSAMTYPMVVLFVACGIMFFLMTKIVPKFADIFRDLLDGEKLPPLTQFVMNTSNLFVKRTPLVLIGIAVVVFLLKVTARAPQGRMILDAIKLKVVIFGPLIHKTAIGRFSRTLGTLLSSGVPILQALNIVRDTAGNAVVAKAVNLVHEAVKEGESVAPPLEASKIFPPMVISMVEVGEETGRLPDMLMRVADSYDDEVDNTVAALSSIIEPLLIVGLAIMVGTIVIALFMPMIAIIGKLGN